MCIATCAVCIATYAVCWWQHSWFVPILACCLRRVRQQSSITITRASAEMLTTHGFSMLDNPHEVSRLHSRAAMKAPARLAADVQTSHCECRSRLAIYR